MFPVPNLFWAGNPKLKWTQYSFPTNDEGGHSLQLIFAKLVGTCQVCNGDQGVMGFNLAHMSRNMSGPVQSMMICEEKILVKIKNKIFSSMCQHSQTIWLFIVYLHCIKIQRIYVRYDDMADCLHYIQLQFGVEPSEDSWRSKRDIFS